MKLSKHMKWTLLALGAVAFYLWWKKHDEQSYSQGAADQIELDNLTFSN